MILTPVLSDVAADSAWVPHVSLLFLPPPYLSSLLLSPLLSSPRVATGEQLGALAAVWQPKSQRRHECCAGGSQLVGGTEERGRRGDRGGELMGVALDEEAMTVEHEAAHAVALLRAVPELPERVHVSQRRSARTVLPPRRGRGPSTTPFRFLPPPPLSPPRHPAGTERTRFQQQEKG